MPPPKQRNPQKHTARIPAHTSSPEVVDPVWILKALGVVVVAAAVCGYATLCGLFYYGQWQLLLQPSHDVLKTPAAEGLQFEPVRFGPDGSGQPQLDGWWIPADLPSDPTVLMLHGGSGSMSDALQQAHALHDARLNVLLFDYRGFGHSGSQHPTEILMEQDSDSAWTYLTQFRHIPASGILVYGNGSGASLAARLCEEHHDLAAMILESADGDFTSRVQRDARSRMVPVSLLFHEQFPLADRLHTLPTPKLLLSDTNTNTPPNPYEQAADPKTTVELKPGDTQSLHESLRRFLDSYITHPPQPLTPNH
jgi:pimeloyl-ACP methyl ester carboxylesterase